jgi:hypothetical protein
MHEDYRRGTLGRDLITALEVFAFAAGAKRVALTHLVDHTGQRLARVFKRWGYTPFEVGYLKHIHQPSQKEE